MRIISVIVLAVLMCSAVAQDKKSLPKDTVTDSKPKAEVKPKPAAFEPNAAQKKDLEIARLRAQLAQKSWEAASNKLPENIAYQNAVSNIGQECKKIITENKWPSTVQCVMPTFDSPFTFADSAAPPEKQ